MQIQDLMQKIPIEVKTFRTRNQTLEMSLEEFWNKVYQDNFLGWWGDSSPCGHGSEGEAITQKRSLLSKCIIEQDVKSILDLGCGEVGWLGEFLSTLQYVGVDIVSDLLEKQRELHLGIALYKGDSSSTEFQELLLRVLPSPFAPPAVDLVIMFDILGHLLAPEIDSVLEFVCNRIQPKCILVSKSRSMKPEVFKEKTREEGVNIELHPRATGYELLAEIPEGEEFCLALYRRGANA